MADPAQNTTGPYGLLSQYFSWGASRENNFKDNDPYTTSMKSHPAVKIARSEANTAIAIDCYESCTSDASGKISYNLGKRSFMGQVGDLINTLVGAATGGLIGKEPEYGVIGSFGSNSSWEAGSVSCAEGKATVKMHVENSMSAASMTRYGYSSPDQTFLDPNPLGETGPLASTSQSWDWTEETTFPSAEGCEIKP